MKIQRIVFYCLIFSLISFGINYHIGKAFIHLATFFSIINITLAFKNKSLKNISYEKNTFITTILLLISALLTMTFFLKFDNKMSDRHFSNMFYPALFFAIILPSLKIKNKDKKVIQFSAIISCVILATSGIFDYFSNNHPTFRTSGLLNLPIIYASCLVILTSWINAEFFKAISNKSWLTAILSFIAICAGFTAIVFTGSRGPILVSSIIFIVLFIYHLISASSKKQKISSIFLLLTIFSAIAVVLPESKLNNVKSRFNDGFNNFTSGFEEEKRRPTSTGIRLDMWEASMVAISDHPFTGIGPGGHVEYFSQLDQANRININTELVIRFDHMHNDFIQAWLSMGVIFGTLSLAFIVYLLYIFLSKDKKEAIIGISVCASFLLCGLTDVPAHNAASLTLFLLLSSLLLAKENYIPQINTKDA